MKNEERRLELAAWILSEIARNGLDAEEYAEPLLQYRARTKKPNKEKKIDDTLLVFDDMIGTSTMVLSRNSKFNFKITKKEFQETGASIDAVNLRIVDRRVAAGEKLYGEYLQTIEGGKIGIDDWKSRTNATANNPYGRDLLVYALHEVQIAKAEVKLLKSYLPRHTTAATKRNTNNRIADCTARINHWLALAVELEKVRPKDESTDESEAESGGADSPIIVEDGTSSAIKTQGETPSPNHEAIRQDFGTPKSPITKPADHGNVLPINTKLKVPYSSFQDDHPIPPNAPAVQRVRLILRTPPTNADGQQKQGTASKPPARKPKRKRIVEDLSDSDGEFQVEEDIKPVRQQVKRRTNPKRRGASTNSYNWGAGIEADEHESE